MIELSNSFENYFQEFSERRCMNGDKMAKYDPTNDRNELKHHFPMLQCYFDYHSLLLLIPFIILLTNKKIKIQHFVFLCNKLFCRSTCISRRSANNSMYLQINYTSRLSIKYQNILRMTTLKNEFNTQFEITWKIFPLKNRGGKSCELY